MTFGADHAVLLGRLEDALRIAPEPTVDLFSKIVAGACTRVPVLGRSGKTSRIAELLACGAWTDAALALVDMELPAWTLRRLVYESGEWFCSLSRQPNLPAAMDDTADGNHELLPLAILLAFVEARRAQSVPRVVSAVPTVQPGAADYVCCENFA